MVEKQLFSAVCFNRRQVEQGNRGEAFRLKSSIGPLNAIERLRCRYQPVGGFIAEASYLRGLAVITLAGQANWATRRDKQINEADRTKTSIAPISGGVIII